MSGHVLASDRTLLGDRAIGRHATIVRAERTAAGERLVVELHGKGVDWLRTTIELHAGVPRLDISYRLAKQGTPAKEAVFFAFPFVSRQSPVAWELTGGVGGTDVPRVPGAAEYLVPIRHWMAFSDAGAASRAGESAANEGPSERDHEHRAASRAGESAANEGPSERDHEHAVSIAWATLEAPLVQLGSIHMPYAPFPPTLDPEPGTIYSWALNNIWDTNFPSQQQGETTFRYAVGSAAGVPARRLGAAVAAGLTDPFVAVLATGSSQAPPSEGFVGVDDPDVLVTSVGRAGRNLVARLQSVAAEPIEVSVTMSGRTPARVRIPACGTALVELGES
jgi:hypothetical protein